MCIKLKNSGPPPEVRGAARRLSPGCGGPPPPPRAAGPPRQLGRACPPAPWRRRRRLPAPPSLPPAPLRSAAAVPVPGPASGGEPLPQHPPTPPPSLCVFAPQGGTERKIAGIPFFFFSRRPHRRADRVHATAVRETKTSSFRVGGNADETLRGFFFDTFLPPPVVVFPLFQALPGAGVSMGKKTREKGRR